MLKYGLKAIIERSFYEGTRIFIGQYQGDELIAIAQPLELKAVSENSRGDPCKPAIVLHRRDEEQFLQSIVDQAWDLGIRPRYARETTPEVNAIKNHLEDMRTLALAPRKEG